MKKNWRIYVGKSVRGVGEDREAGGERGGGSMKDNVWYGCKVLKRF